MAQQQIPWWWQFYQGQQPQQDPNYRTHLGPEAGGGSFRSLGSDVTSPTQTSPRAQGPPTPPDFSNSVVDIPPAEGFDPNATYGSPEDTFDSSPGQPFTHFMSGTPIAGVPTAPYPSYGGWNAAIPNNPPPNEASQFGTENYGTWGPMQNPNKPFDTSQTLPHTTVVDLGSSALNTAVGNTGANIPPDEEMLANPAALPNPEPVDSSANATQPQIDQYQGGWSSPDQYSFNPTPNETSNFYVDQYLQPDVGLPAPNEGSTFYADQYIAPELQNIVPNESATWNLDQYRQPDVTNPVPNETSNFYLDQYRQPDPTNPVPVDSGQYGPPSDTNFYFPAGDGGNYVYDENFQPQGYQAPPEDQPDQPSTIATGSDVTPPSSISDLPGGEVPLLDNPASGNNAEPVPPPFIREGSGMMGTWQDYANTFTPYQSPFDTVPTSGLYGGRPTSLPGSFTGLGSGGGGNLGNWQPFKNMFYGNVPYTPENFSNFIGWENSQGNALQGAKWYPGQTPGPITSPNTNYGDYLSSWNAINSNATTPVETDPYGSFGHSVHSGPATNAQ